MCPDVFVVSFFVCGGGGVVGGGGGGGGGGVWGGGVGWYVLSINIFQSAAITKKIHFITKCNIHFIPKKQL